MATSSITPNALYAMQYLQNKNWTKEQAAGLVGNFQAESTVNLNVSIEGDRSKITGKNLAYGIAQWHPDRQAEFQKQYNKPIQGSSLDDQLEFVNYELTQGKFKTAGNALKGAKTASDAAIIVDKRYEISALSQQNIHTKRVAYANVLAGSNPSDIVQRGKDAAKSKQQSVTDSLTTNENSASNDNSADIVSNKSDPTTTNQASTVFTTPLPNPLLSYPSYTYGLSLHLLSKSEYASVVKDQTFKPTRVLIASAGRWNNETFPRSKYFSEDFYFEDLNILTVVAANEHSRSTNAVDIKFNIIEPYGMTLMNRLIEANADTDVQSPNYIEQPYLLQIDFFGINDAGEIQGAIPNLQKNIPIKIIGLTLKATNKGASYACQAVPYNSTAYDSSTASTPAHIEISAGTLSSFFHSDAEESYIEEMHKTEADRAFINETFNRKNPDTTRYTNVAAAPQSVLAPDPNFAEKFAPQPTETETIYKVNSYGTSLNAWYKDLRTRHKIGEADTYAFVIHPDILAKEKFILQDNMAKSDSVMAKNATTAAAQRKSNANDTQSTALSFDGRTFSLNTGTSIDKVIDFAMRQTTYLQEQIVAPEAFTDPEAYANAQEKYKNEPLRWYKIVPVIILGEYDIKRESYARQITYNIIPQLLWNNKLKEAPQGVITTPVKQHNYYYTGANDDVIDLNIEFNALYYTSITAYRENVLYNYNVALNDVGDRKLPEVLDYEDMNNVQRLKKKWEVYHAISRSTGGEVTPLQAALNDVEQSLYTSAGGDMITADIKIIGDPHYIKQDDLFYRPNMRPAAEMVDSTGVDPRLIANNALHMDSTGVYIHLNVRSAYDINEGNSLMKFNKNYETSVFTGLYQVLTVESMFTGGMFTQKLSTVRLPNQPTRSFDPHKNNTERTANTQVSKSALPPVIAPTIVTNYKADSAPDIVTGFTGVTNTFAPASIIENEQMSLMAINNNKAIMDTPINSQNVPQAVVPDIYAARAAKIADIAKKYNLDITTTPLKL